MFYISGRGKVKNNLDFLSEIYNTAFSKLPKVRNQRSHNIKFLMFASCTV